MRGTCETGLSERFEVDGWVAKVSSQSRDILFKKIHPIFVGSRLLLPYPDEMGGGGEA